jgi:hypothetical protein
MVIEQVVKLSFNDPILTLGFLKLESHILKNILQIVKTHCKKKIEHRMTNGSKIEHKPQQVLL